LEQAAHENDGPTAVSSPLQDDAVLSTSTLTPVTSDNRVQTESMDGQLKRSKDYGTIKRNGSNSKLYRIYSENETSNFNSIDGRRMYDDDRHRPHRTRTYENPTPEDPLNRIVKINSSRSFPRGGVKRTIHHESLDLGHGMEDEYIPDFDFSSAIQQWTDSYYHNDASFDSSVSGSVVSTEPPRTPVGESHAQVKPVSVPKHDMHQQGQIDEEEFIVSKLPRNFSDLPFSVRRKLMTDLSLSPLVSRDSIEKIVKKRFKRSKNQSSPALQFLSSFSERSKKSEDKIVMDHSLGRIIGSGAWGIIRECCGPDGCIRAMKVIRAKNEAVKDVFRRETNVWKKMKHPYLLPLLNVKETENTFFCLTNKACGGTLFDLVSKWGLNISEENITTRERLHLTKKYGLQIIKALMYMHQRGFVHGDVKLENCLLDREGAKGKVLVCDFGMSVQYKVPEDSDDIVIKDRMIKRRPSIPRSYSGSKLRHLRSLERIYNDKSQVHDDTRLQLNMTESKSSTDSDVLSFDPSPIAPKPEHANPNLPDSHIGSLPYAAPELLESCPPPLGPSADVWAFGVLMYTMLVGKLPFQHQYEPRLRAMISAAKYDTESLKRATKGEKNFIDVVKGCMTKDLTKRLTFEEAERLLVSAEA
jgi:protein-serine/threonine kinase